MTIDKASVIIKVRSTDYCSKNINLWDELVSVSDADFLFSNYNWLLSFWESYGDVFSSKVYIAVEETTQKWLGILPVTTYKTGLFDLYTDICSSTASEYSDYFSPIIHKKHSNQILPLLLNYFLDKNPNTHLFRLSNIINNQDLHSTIEETLTERRMPFTKLLSGCPILKFNNKNKTEIFNSFKKKHRNDITRQLNRLNNVGKLKIKIFQDDFQKEENWYSFLKMYKNRWTNSNQVDQMSRSQNKLFFKNMLKNLNNAVLHFSALYLDDKPISYHIGFIYNNWFYYYKPTFDIDFSSYSPGKIHIWLLIEKGCEEGWEAFDFLKGFESYKKNWTNDVNNTLTYIISNNKWFRYRWQIEWKTKFLFLIRKIPKNIIYRTKYFFGMYNSKI